MHMLVVVIAKVCLLIVGYDADLSLSVRNQRG